MDPAYLNAKKPVDDQSLNTRVWNALIHALGGKPSPRVIDIGAGGGAALHRGLEWGLWGGNAGILPQHYLCIDTDSDCEGDLAAAARRLRRKTGSPTEVVIADAADLPEAKADLLIAHAVMDLFSPPNGARLISRHLVPGGIAYTPITYAMPTLWYPTPPELAALDAEVSAAYDASMHRDGHTGQAAALLAHWPRLGLRCLSAGSSDWVILPGEHPRFLQCLLKFTAASVHLEGIERWLDIRRAQLNQGALGLIAHNLDILWRKTP